MLATLADHGGFIVTAHSPACGRATVLDLEILIFRYGADMPLEALRRRARWPQCGDAGQLRLAVARTDGREPPAR